jgi:hypothetical protein
MIQKKCVNCNNCGHTYVFIAWQIEYTFFKFVKFFVTLNTLSLAGRIKQITKLIKHEMYEKCGMGVF